MYIHTISAYVSRGVFCQIHPDNQIRYIYVYTYCISLCILHTKSAYTTLGCNLQNAEESNKLHVSVHVSYGAF